MKRSTQTPAEIVAVIPVFDDWVSLAGVLGDLAEALGNRIGVVIINDGSNVPPSFDQLHELSRGFSWITLIELDTNLGHQRAIAIGVAQACTIPADFILVMDADGEDPPSEVPRLIEAAMRWPGSTVLAKRGKRQVDLFFRIGYFLYRLTFRVLTGLKIDTGNFVLIPHSIAKALASSDWTLVNLTASIMRMRVPTVKVKVDRAPRLSGESRMNPYSLVSHGFGAMSVFTDRIFLRVIVAAAIILAFCAAATASIIAIRFLSDLAIPGWATLAIGILTIVAIQVLTTVALFSLVMLSGQRSAAIGPNDLADHHIESLVHFDPIAPSYAEESHEIEGCGASPNGA